MGCSPSVSGGPSAPADPTEGREAAPQGAAQLKNNRLSLDSGAQPGDADVLDSPESSLRLLTLESIRDDDLNFRRQTATNSPMQEFVPLGPTASVGPSKSQVRSPSSTSRHTLLSQGLSTSAFEDDQRSLSQTEVIMADLHAVSASGSSRQLLELAHRLPRQVLSGNNGETGSSCSFVDDREECERLLDNEDC